LTRATKYNDGDAETWLKLGETEERLKDKPAARDAYQNLPGPGVRCEGCGGCSQAHLEAEVNGGARRG
jgi:hypothetical protein